MFPGLIQSLALVAVVASAAEQVPAPNPALVAVFSRIDRAAADFRGLTANIRRVTHTDFVNEDTVDIGTIRIRRVKPHDLRVLIDFTKPDPKTVAFQGKKAEIFYPRMNTVDEYDLGKYRDLVDQFLLLGFGSTSKDLQDAYNVRLVGPETVDGQKATEIELTPKSKDVLQQIKRFELWISDSNGLPLQIKYYPSGQNILITYSEIKVNPADLREADLKLQLPKGTKRVYPQKGS